MTVSIYCVSATGIINLPLGNSEHAELIAIIDTKQWITELKRRVQHYGYKYDYKSRDIDQNHYLGQIPDWLHDICEKLRTEGIVAHYPDQVIINEYTPGQGISAHIDCVPCFGNTICSLSLGSRCVMDFTKNTFKKSILLEPRSLLTLQNDARYLWKHSIPARKSDRTASANLVRDRRISLTFRSLETVRLEMIEDMEDTELALYRLKNPQKMWTQEELEAELELEN
ncbi:MAG: alpha-ketoglutarate-dependent dioxygenase AlkB [Alphaproteobacteria bacterium]